MGLLCAAVGAGPTARSAAVEAVLGQPAAGTGATRGAVAEDVLGSPVVGALGLELTTMGEEARCTRGQKECAPWVFTIAGLDEEKGRRSSSLRGRRGV